jgi:UDP:flavonoid glycosyltransferase YjiC (YdhE family)
MVLWRGSSLWDFGKSDELLESQRAENGLALMAQMNHGWTRIHTDWDGGIWHKDSQGRAGVYPPWRALGDVSRQLRAVGGWRMIVGNGEHAMGEMRRYIFVPLGSAGDVNPLLWLAGLVRGAGHEVVFITHAGVEELPKMAGFRTVGVGEAEDADRVIRNPDLWHPDRAFELLAGQLPLWARVMVPAIRDEVVSGKTVLVAGGLAFGARIVAEADRVPLVTVQLQPSVFMGVDDAPILRSRLGWLKRAPLWMRRVFFGLVHWRVDQLMAGPVNEMRRSFGLERSIRGVMRDWWMSPDRVLAMFPEWFAPLHADWPAQTVLTRFPLYDLGDARPVGSELEAFLGAGEPPVLMTPGSANLHAREFFAEGVEGCRRIGRRALLVTGHAGQVPARLPAGSAHFEYAPFGQVFGRCAAVVHHGGIGTCSQGLSAGVPQLLMPMAHDQPDNAWRLERLGVAAQLRPGRFRAAAVGDALRRLIGSADVGAACHRVQGLVARQMAPEEVGRLLDVG